MIRCQQFELYGAEEKMSTRGRTFDDVSQMIRYVNDLRDHRFFRLTYPEIKRVEVYGLSMRDTASVGGFDNDPTVAILEMHPLHFNELYLLHELAHPLARNRFGSNAHDPSFVRVYLELVSLMMGSDAYVELAQHFKDAGIVGA